MKSNEKTIRVGSRESALAVAQSVWVIERIRRAHPELRIELVTMTSTGDRILDTTLEKIGGKGLFTKELEAALLGGEIDIAVHSLKDVPMELDERLPIVAYSQREDPRDALVFRDGVIKPVVAGCSSARRRVQLSRLFEGIEVESVRGNVNTRLRKLDVGQYDFLVLAAAGLNRLGLGGRISRLLSIEEMLPAACQGVLGVQGRLGEDYGFLDCVNDRGSALCSQAERVFVATLGGGCTLPVAAYAQKSGEEIKLEALYADEERNIFIRKSIVTDPERVLEAAGKLAKEIAASI